MNRPLLEHFLAAYEAGSLGKAALHLGLTQPALSKSIRKLEQQLDLQLFHRSPKGIVPTPYADALARRGQAIRADIDNSITELRRLQRGEVGQARIGIAPALAPDFMPEVVARTARHHPSIDITVIEGLYEGIWLGVVRGELDFGLTNLPPRGLDPDLIWRDLLRDRFVICCGYAHPLAPCSPIDTVGLLDFPWITPAREGVPWQRLTDLFAAAGYRPPRATLETNSASMIKALLLKGPFLAFVPRQLIRPELARGEVVELPVPGMTMERSITVVSRQRRVPPVAAQLVLDTCELVAREQEGG